MSEAPQNNPITLEDLLRELEWSDRVVLETENALGEMDANYMPASELLAALTEAHKAAVQAAYERCAEIADEEGGEQSDHKTRDNRLYGLACANVADAIRRAKEDAQ